MIIGGCPYCDASQWNAYVPGKMQKIKCEGCTKTYWLRHSNIDPVAYTEDEFAERYEVNEETHEITDKWAKKQKKSRAENPEIWALIDKKMKEAEEKVAREIEDHLLWGKPLSKWGL